MTLGVIAVAAFAAPSLLFNRALRFANNPGRTEDIGIRMTLSRIALAIAAVGFTSFGVACLARPKQMLKLADVKATSTRGETELRAMYGGMELGLGAFFALAMSKPAWRRPALAAQALGLGAVAAARIGGIVQDRPRGKLMKAFAVAESSAAMLGAIALIADRDRAALRRVA